MGYKTVKYGNLACDLDLKERFTNICHDNGLTVVYVTSNVIADFVDRIEVDQEFLYEFQIKHKNRKKHGNSKA